jgi:hypothetical protein
MNVAEQYRIAPTWTVVLGLVPEQAPPQPLNWNPASAVAWSVTDVDCVNVN